MKFRNELVSSAESEGVPLTIPYHAQEYLVRSEICGTARGAEGMSLKTEFVAVARALDEAAVP